MTESQQTLFAADTHASHSVMPGSELARQTTAISGRKCIDLLKLSNRNGCVARTLLATSRWASTLCYLTWKPRTTPGGRLLFQLAPSMPDTGVIESGLLPTPDCQNHRDGTNLRQITKDAAERGSRRGVSLHHHATMWPTPAATDYKGSVTGGSLEARRNKPEGVRLPEQVMRMFSTPNTPRPHDSENTAGKYMPSQKQRDLITDVAMGGGQLNPVFVEWLMGFPTEWTALKPSEMQSSPPLLRS